MCRRLGIASTTYRNEHAVAWRKACASVGELLRGDWCERHRDMLDAYAAGSATPAQIHGAQRHLRNCPGCRARVAAIRLAATTSVRDAFLVADCGRRTAREPTAAGRPAGNVTG